MDALLVRSLRESMDTRTQDVPSTASEFEENFRPYEERINHFMEIFTSGRLKQVGWDPSEVEWGRGSCSADYGFVGLATTIS